MGDLGEKVKNRQKRIDEINKSNNTIEFFSKEHGAGGKDKAISARVNGDTFDDFRKICKRKGLSANACINMLISEYVFNNKNYLNG